MGTNTKIMINLVSLLTAYFDLNVILTVLQLTAVSNVLQEVHLTCCSRGNPLPKVLLCLVF